MNSSQAILTGLVAAVAAGCAQAVAHHYAERHHWPRIPRYACGLTIVNVAVAPVLYVALPLEQAAILYGLIWLIGGASGLATWLAYQAEPPQSRPRPLIDVDELDRLAESVASEHRD